MSSKGSDILGELLGRLIVRLVIYLIPVIWNGLRAGVDWCLRKMTPSTDRLLVRFVDKGDKNAVRAALKEGANVNAFNSEALCRAVRKGNEEMVDLLLEQKRIDVHGIGEDGEKLKFLSNRPLYEAYTGKFNSIAKKLIARGASDSDLLIKLDKDMFTRLRNENLFARNPVPRR